MAKAVAMLKKIMKTLRVLILFVLIIQLAGCGTLMYPERKGQKGTRIDMGIAVLDGIGLLVFLVPGILAYVIDFYTGAIYLPAAAMGSPVLQDIKKKLGIL